MKKHVQLLQQSCKVQLQQSRSAASALRSAAFRTSPEVMVVFIRKLGIREKQVKHKAVEGFVPKTRIYFLVAVFIENTNLTIILVHLCDKLVF